MEIVEEIHEHVKKMPFEMANEVLNFIQKIELKYQENQKTPVQASNFYQSLLQTGFIGCGEAPEDLSANYKAYLSNHLKIF